MIVVLVVATLPLYTYYINLMDTSHVYSFCSGALLPTIAYYFFYQRQERRIQQAYEDEDDDDEDDEGEYIPSDCSSWNASHAPYKMILVVNRQLKMTKGKIGAQCGHAAVGCVQVAQRVCPQALNWWNRLGCAKICVGLPDDETMEGVQENARHLPSYLVHDAGRTQIAAGSQTVLALFGPAAAFEGITDHMKLL